LVLAGCAQKSATEVESAEVGKSREVQAEAQKPTEEKATEKEAVGEAQTTKKEQVDEYGINGEEAQKDKESARKGLSEQAKQTLRKRIHFAFDSSRLSQKAQEILKAKARILKDHPEQRMMIAGHCDERGTDEYNIALGERRARAAYEYLVLLGVDADRMDLVSYGEERPLVEGHNKKAWAKNRRDEFKILE
jgi:peptidoglycan-associated lipoprotein